MTMMQQQAEIVVKVRDAGAIGLPVSGGGLGSDSPTHVRRAAPVRITRVRALWWLAGLMICMGWDRAAWLGVSIGGKARLQWLKDLLKWDVLAEAVNAGQWRDVAAGLAHSVVYWFGTVWPWLAVGIVLIFRDWSQPDTAKVRDGLRRGVFVCAVPAVAGGAAEVLKVVTRRMRPEHANGFYRFKPLDEGGPLTPEFWYGSELALASSHAAVAVGGAIAAGVLWPRTRWWMFALAALCCVSRIAVGAHFVSDVYVGAAIGVLSVVLFYAWDRRNHHGEGLGGLDVRLPA